MRALLASAMLFLLAACGLQPMYAGGAGGQVAQGLAAVEVPPIAGRAGWLVRNALTDRLGAAGDASARYRLDVRLDDRLEGLGIFWKDERDLAAQLQHWRGGELDRLVAKLVALHRALLANSQAAELQLSQGLAEIARRAAQRR